MALVGNFQEALKQLLGARCAEFETLNLCCRKKHRMCSVAKTGRTTSMLW